MVYLFTFHTNFDANIALRKLKTLGSVKMKPVPRVLSSSCGTAVLFSTTDRQFQLNTFLDLSFEKVYQVDDQNYTLLFEKSWKNAKYKTWMHPPGFIFLFYTFFRKRFFSLGQLRNNDRRDYEQNTDKFLKCKSLF